MSSTYLGFANAISSAEGFGVAGAIPTLANNPGDLKIGDVGYGTMGSGITVFGSVQDGWNALLKQIDKIATGKSSFYNTDMTLQDMGKTWSGGDSNWVKNVSGNLGVSADTKVGDVINKPSDATPSWWDYVNGAIGGIMGGIATGDPISGIAGGVADAGAARASESGGPVSKYVTIAVGLICIAVGLMMFKTTQTVITTVGKAAVQGAKLAA